MGCACKKTTDVLPLDGVLPSNNDKMTKKTTKNTLNRWVTFVFLSILSPLFIFPIIYMFYKVLIKTETLNVSDFFKNIIKIIKYKIKMEQDGEMELSEYEIHELKEDE